MSARVTREAEDQAIAWVMLTRDPGFGDWEGFTAWLEASPEHARLYDELMLADERIAAQLARSTPAVRQRWRWSRCCRRSPGPALRRRRSRARRGRS